MGQLHSGPMAGRTVLVTGASAGIGRATALGLARMGADLAICGRPSRSGRAQQADGDGDIGMALWLPLRGRIRRGRKPGQASTGRPSGKIQTNCHPRHRRRPRSGEDGSPGGSARRGCGRGGRCWVQPKQAGHVLPRHAAVVNMSQYGVAQGPWTLGSWQQCLSTIGSCRPGTDRARGLSGNPLGGFAREYAMFMRTGEPQRWRCSPGSRRR